MTYALSRVINNPKTKNIEKAYEQAAEIMVHLYCMSLSAAENNSLIDCMSIVKQFYSNVFEPILTNPAINNSIDIK
jgi:hypothetical protein